MNHSVANEPSPVMGATETGGIKTPSLSLAWAITIGEAILWGALVWVFADYWLMLPVRYRWWGILVLAGLAAIGLVRLVKFYRRFRLTRTGPEAPPPEQRSN
ncbi:MAG TPA: hypothetical protein VJW76_06475 [Verrucomicrobiae bacterium]|nr:hypothetical protein [Verrucomicrobiae bacterium]